jgi:hypothetical protein
MVSTPQLSHGMPTSVVRKVPVMVPSCWQIAAGSQPRVATREAAARIERICDARIRRVGNANGSGAKSGSCIGESQMGEPGDGESGGARRLRLRHFTERVVDGESL